MDSMTDEEKLKSPVVIGGLALLVAPFIVGAIALAFYRVRRRHLLLFFRCRCTTSLPPQPRDALPLTRARFALV